MERQKIHGTLIVLVFIQSMNQIEAAGFGAGKDSTNAKDLKEIETKMQEGTGSMKGAWEQIIIMKTEQHAFEIDLRNMMEKNPEAPADMKKMLEDQTEMQDELTKMQLDVKECQNKFENWIADMQKLQENPTDMATYEALKPFLRELDAVADQLKIIPPKLIDQAKRYKDFGQSMFDSDTVDAAVNKRLCALGTKIEETGYQVSDIGDPITITSQRVANIWQRTYPKDKDNVLSRITKTLTPKGNEIVTDGDNQANSGTALKKICKKVAEKVPPPAVAEGDTEADLGACKEELDAISKGLEEFSKEGSDLEILKVNFEAVMNLETEFESLANGVSNASKISKDFGNLAAELSKIKQEIIATTTKIQVDEPCDGKTIEGFGNNLHGVFTTLLGVAKKSVQLAENLLSNGKFLVDKTKFHKVLKVIYDIVGDKVQIGGSLLLDGILLGKIEDIGQRFASIGKSLGSDSQSTILAIGNIMKLLVGPLKSYAGKAIDYGKEIVSLEASAENNESTETSEGTNIPETTENSESPKDDESIDNAEATTKSALNLGMVKPMGRSMGLDSAKKPGGKKGKGSNSKDANGKDIEQMEKDLDAIEADLQNILKDLEAIKAEQEAVEQQAGKGYPGKKKVVPRKIDALNKDCKAIAKSAKSLSKDLPKAKKSKTEEIGKSCEKCITNKMLDVANKTVEFGEKLAGLGKKLGSNGRNLKKKGLLTPPIMEKLKVQGTKTEKCGDKVENIAGKFDQIGSKMSDIGERLEGDNSATLSDASGKLKDFSGKIKTHGGKTKEFGKEVQMVNEAKVSDKDTDKEEDEDEEARR